MKKLGIAGATIGTAALWASRHEKGVARLVFVFVLGVIYAEIYRRRQSLVPTVTFHIVPNTFVTIFRGGYLGTSAYLLAVSLMLSVVSAVLYYLVREKWHPNVPRTAAKQ
jgi:membrane protease YdiL (CAAX protease family)